MAKKKTNYSVFIYSEAAPDAKYAIYKHTRKFRVLQYLFSVKDADKRSGTWTVEAPSSVVESIMVFLEAYVKLHIPCKNTTLKIIISNFLIYT